MSGGRIECRKGDPCRFTVAVSSGIAADYTRARFQVRREWSEEADALIAVDETSGITIRHAENEIDIHIGATLTDALPVLRQPLAVAAQLRLYHTTDADDRMSFPIPFLLLPDVIDDD